MKNLMLIGKKYYVRKAVPADLQKAIGKKLITRKTETGDLKEAEKRGHKILAEIDKAFDMARGNFKGWEAPEIIINDAREAVATDGGVQWQDATLEWLDHNNPTPEQTEAIKIGFDIATGKQVMSLSEGRDHYLKHIENKVINQTYNNKKQRIQNLIDSIGDRQIKDITRLQAMTYVTANIIDKFDNINSRKNNLRDIVAFFSWCLDSDIIDKSVFANIKVEAGGRAKKAEQPPRHWEDDELKKLLSMLLSKKKASDPLIPMTQIGMYSGMRINELCELKTENITSDYFEVVESKNENSLRKIPIHDAIKPMVKKLIKNSKDGYLLTGLEGGGADNKRSHSIQKRFGNFIRTHVTKDKGLVFHSLRRAFTNKLEIAGVPVSTGELLLGHARQSMSYGRYSKSLPLEQLKKAVNLVSYKL